MKPFRILAAILMIMIAAEIYGIMQTPTYDAELKEAKAAYEDALKENMVLKKAARARRCGWSN